MDEQKKEVQIRIGSNSKALCVVKYTVYKKMSAYDNPNQTSQALCMRLQVQLTVGFVQEKL